MNNAADQGSAGRSPHVSDQPLAKSRLNEDWLAVILAFLLIALAAVGVLGKAGVPITF